MAKIKVGDKAYDSGDVVITLLGNSPNEVTEITYGVEQEHQLNYGLGSNKATSWSMGRENPTSTITMSMREVVAIEDSIQGNSKNLMSIAPFEIYITYVNEYAKIVTDKVLCKFQNQGREVNGQMGLGKQFQLFTLDTEFNIN